MSTLYKLKLHHLNWKFSLTAKNLEPSARLTVHQTVYSFLNLVLVIKDKIRASHEKDEVEVLLNYLLSGPRPCYALIKQHFFRFYV